MSWRDWKYPAGKDRIQNDLSTIRETAWKNTKGPIQPGPCAKSARPRPEPRAAPTRAWRARHGWRALRGEPPAKRLLLTGSCTWAPPSRFCEKGKRTPAWVDGHLNPATSLSRRRAPADPLRPVLNTALQKTRWKSLREKQWGLENMKKSLERGHGDCLPPFWNRWEPAPVSQDHPVNYSPVLYRIRVFKKFIFRGLLQTNKRKD